MSAMRPPVEGAAPPEAETSLRDEYYSLLEKADSATSHFNSVQLNSITSNDTLVVVDMQIDFLPGGSFGVAEGHSVLDGICYLIGEFHKKGATVIASRDFHPQDHCSFLEQGGPFPAHCIMGTEGSMLHPKIANTLQPLIAKQIKEKEERTVHVVYKGFTRDIESFGGFRYQDDDEHHWKNRLSYNKNGSSYGGNLLDWTGAYSLHASNLANDANAPPDVMAILDKKPVSDLLPKGGNHGRTFVCGLALDYCVIDTAANYCGYAKNKLGGGDSDYNPNCYIVQNLTRAAHVPGLGKFGSGFLTDPEVLLQKITAAKIGFMRFE